MPPIVKLFFKKKEAAKMEIMYLEEENIMKDLKKINMNQHER